VEVKIVDIWLNMGRKRIGNYKPRQTKTSLDQDRGSKSGFVSYFLKPENAEYFRSIYHKEPTQENIIKEYKGIYG